jgi:hypothetical protein
MEKGKELEFSRRAGGGKGEPGVPPKTRFPNKIEINPKHNLITNQKPK